MFVSVLILAPNSRFSSDWTLCTKVICLINTMSRLISLSYYSQTSFNFTSTLIQERALQGSLNKLFDPAQPFCKTAVQSNQINNE
jgi:hypothetical protein